MMLQPVASRQGATPTKRQQRGVARRFNLETAAACRLLMVLLLLMHFDAR